MNASQPQIKIFSRKEICAWLNDNHEVAGLSGAVISPTRAYAIAQNPYLQDDDPVAAALFIGNELAAFTASFPDRIGDKTYHWFSTLWCSPKHQGKGYGLLVVGSLCEIFGIDTCLDMWGAPETISIFQYLGHNTTTVPEYRFEPKHFKRGSMKGEVAYAMHRLKHVFSRPMPLRNPVHNYTLRYRNTIDGNTYRFISQHSANDLIPRTHEMLNWILANHFVHRAPLMDSEPRYNPFDDRDSRYWMSGVEVIADNRTVGFYILRDADSEMSVKYLYFNPDYLDCIFHSIARHITLLGNPSFSTRNRQLADFISKLKWFERETVCDVSFSYPDSFTLSPTAVSQGGDGDGFA